jgi:amino acid transporter
MMAEIQAISYGYTFDNQTEFQALINDLSATVVQSLFQSYGFKAPDSYNSNDTTTVSAKEQLQADAVVISLVFLYFFISAGSMLFFMGLLNFLTLPRAEFKHHVASHKELALRFSAYIVAGIILCLLAVMVHSTSGHNLEESAWLLPLLTIMIVAVLLAQYVHFSGEELEDLSDSEEERDEVEDDREGDDKGPSQPSSKPKPDMKEEVSS